MSNYLKGFNDGYYKALELTGKPQLSVTLDSEDLTKHTYKEVTELLTRDVNIKERLNAE